VLTRRPLGAQHHRRDNAAVPLGPAPSSHQSCVSAEYWIVDRWEPSAPGARAGAPTKGVLYCRSVPETAYARCGDLSLAYQVFGEGPTDLVFASSFVSHVELMWTLPEFKAWLDHLGSFCRILVFDKAGVGLSDPVPKVRSIDDRAAEIEAVMDAAGFGQAVAMGVSEGGPATIVFAATRPDRVKALILTGTFAWSGFVAAGNLAREPQEVREELRAELGEEYAPSAEQIARLQVFDRAVQSTWGSGESLRGLVPSVRSMQQLGMLERMCASPGMARATIEAVMRIDVGPVLARSRCLRWLSTPVTTLCPSRAGAFWPITSLALASSKWQARTTPRGSPIRMASPTPWRTS
jgi:pimeloyl-ACP methyl ester carboxylesterase